MGTKGRRAAVAMLSLCLGLSGCVTTDIASQPSELTATGWTLSTGPGALASRAIPSADRTLVTAGAVADPLAGTEAVQTSYRPLSGLPGGAMALGAISVDSPTPGATCCPRE